MLSSHTAEDPLSSLYCTRTHYDTRRQSDGKEKFSYAPPTCGQTGQGSNYKISPYIN